MFRRRSLTCIAVAALLVVAAPPAQAQEDPRKALSTPFFEEGLRLADKGRQSEALENFEKAYQRYPSPNTLFNIARAEHLLGRRLEALGHYREALRNPVLLPQNAAQASAYIAELERALGRLNVIGPAGATITVGLREARLPLSEPLDVEPGTVVVKGESRGTTYETRALVVAGETAAVELRAKRDAVSSGSPGPVGSPASAGTSAGLAAPASPDVPTNHASIAWSMPRIATVSALGVGAVAGAVLGFAFHGAALDAAAESRAGQPFGCKGMTGPLSPACARAQALRSDHDRDVALSTASFVGAGILGAGAIAAAALWPTSRARTGLASKLRVTGTIHRTAVGADVAFSF